MKTKHPFRQSILDDFTRFIRHSEEKFPANETLKIDLHCHDHNSTVPDELWGRLLRLPETWLPTEDLVRSLKSHNTDLITITNHNNATSCWDLLDKGYEVLPAAEFTCKFPDLPVSVHVLTYGLTPQHEIRLQKLRQNIYRFLSYTLNHDLPTVLAHPLYYYTHGDYKMELEVWEKFALLFDRFEVFNGQRDVWQNLLVKDFIKGLNEETLTALSKKHSIPVDAFCRNPFHKAMAGGSDDHFGIFAGSNGTLLHVPNLKEALKKNSKADLALQALRTGQMTPYGQIGEEEKLNAALLNYLCQVAINMEDPGLIRLMLHQGSLQDKFWTFLIGNTMMEVKRHKYTMRFFKAVDNAFSGRKMKLLDKLMVSRDYRPVIEDLEAIATTRRENPENFCNTLRDSFPRIFSTLNKILLERSSKELGKLIPSNSTMAFNFERALEKMEMPLHIRSIGDTDKSKNKMSALQFGHLFDELSFPVLASGIVAGASLISSNHLYQERPFLNTVSQSLDKHKHPKKVLWLTDTLTDHNGVASVLQQNLEFARLHNLEIDFLTCSNDIQSGDHLHILPAQAEFSIPGYESQKIRIPNLLDILRIVKDGAYDRIICSTELLMGGISLYLKLALNIPVYFYMHTDWMDFVVRNTKIDAQGQDRVRRFLRAFYQQFDGIFVLNEEHRDWLGSEAIGIDEDKIFMTAHWPDARFQPGEYPRQSFVPDYHEGQKIILFAGRLSQEKGVFDLPEIFAEIRKNIPEARLVIAGSGPAEQKLRRVLPDAVFTGWVDHTRLPELYNAADMLVLPSRFDTFGCVVLEALSCGTPAACYNTKGPRDIITHGEDGVLADSAAELGREISDFLRENRSQESVRMATQLKAIQYNPESIMKHLMLNLGMPWKPLKTSPGHPNVNVRSQKDKSLPAG